MPSSDEPTAQAQAIMERLLALVKDCRVVLPALERGNPGESSSAEAERTLYFALMSAIGAGLIRTTEEALQEGARVVHVGDARGHVVTARTHPRLLAHRATLPASGEPLVDGVSWMQSEAGRRVVAYSLRGTVLMTSVSR